MQQNETNPSKFHMAIFSIGVLYTIGATLYFGFVGKSAEMGVALLTGIFIMAFANLDMFSFFEGAGFRAETRGRIKAAEVSLETLRELVTLIAGPILEELTFGGRLSNIDFFARRKMMVDLIEYMKKLNIQDPNINQPIETIDRFLVGDHISKIDKAVQEDVNLGTEIKKDIQEKIQKIRTEVNRQMRFDPGPIKFLLADVSSRNLEIKEAIEDLEFFLQHKKARRPSIWELE